ncbi:similar to Saccharomyces cerevisiae YPR061C JID1 Probable Hsp40p co-chaperone [Maudiozyma saulgeensis]|uniref:Similar to Saccharomyces cerevisiae YPR061C JID1 Probable Hsp40p co-chaperone n=1 Tax=Maudiozyma saulgeensis TaxID=1789683 RepID=A0A1X7R4L2_9SACH|nr:similar to Saccharomyces cerevisiae YPR061C JID1 Probable Hsp40p co-chaperone [Kazachstania saulgeensis]
MITFFAIAKINTKRSLINRIGRSYHFQNCRYYAKVIGNDALELSRKSNRRKEPLQDSQWPGMKYPTPYEIFGINSQVSTHLTNTQLSDLKKKYHKYVKLYHPDISLSRDIADHAIMGKILTTEEKVNRFKTISQAYDILTNKNKKRLYDLNRSNWSHGRPSTTDLNDIFRSRNFSSDDTSRYWHAGTWEDMYEFNERNKNNDDDSSRQHKYVIYWAIGMLICIEGSVLLSKIESTLVGKVDYGITADDVEKGLFSSYQNYGLDDDKLSRIKRFLWFRSWGLYTNQDELDREAKANETLLNSISDPETGELIKPNKKDNNTINSTTEDVPKDTTK